MTSRERFQAQLDRCCRTTPKKVLTGIEKHLQEQEELKKFWKALADEKLY